MTRAHIVPLDLLVRPNPVEHGGPTAQARRKERATGPDHYEIRLSGHLDARWAAWFDGLTVSHDGDGTTVISGPIADQSALHGVLQRVRDLGVPLIAVTRIDHPPKGPRP